MIYFKFWFLCLEGSSNQDTARDNIDWDEISNIILVPMNEVNDAYTTDKRKPTGSTYSVSPARQGFMHCTYDN
jgi:hypothetical protein